MARSRPTLTDNDIDVEAAVSLPKETNPLLKPEIPIPETETPDTVVLQTNRLQRIGQVAQSYTVSVALTAVLMREFLPSAAIPQPYNELVRSGLVLAGITTVDALHALSERKEPWSGFAPAKYALATIPPLVTNTGIGWVIRAYGAELMTSQDSTLQALAFVLQNPAMHTAVTAALTYAEFGITKLLIECCTKPAKTNEEGADQLTLLQQILRDGIRFIEPLALYEMLRMTLIEFGQSAVTHNQYFPLIIVALDQLLKLTGYMARIPTPFDNLVPKVLSEHKYTHQFDTGLGAVVPAVSPSNKDIAKYSAYYATRALVAITAGGCLASELLKYMDGETDEEKLVTTDRLLSLMMMVGATGFVEKAFDIGAKVASHVLPKVSNCFGTLYHRLPSMPSLGSRSTPAIENKEAYPPALYAPSLRRPNY
jgi:hypothetical protein